MEKVCTRGIMEKYMMENGTMVSSMDTASGKASLAIHISANGDIQKLKATEFITGRQVIDMKENGSNA